MHCLGIDIGASRAACVLLTRSGKTMQVAQSWEVIAPADGTLEESIRASIATQCQNVPDAVAASLPAGSVSHRLLHLPFTDPARLRATIPFELESEVPFDLDKSVVAWEIRERHSQSSSVVAALAPDTAVGEALARLELAGLDPAVLTPASLALADAVEAEHATLLVDARVDGAVVKRDAQGIVAFHGLGGGDQDALLAEIRWAVGALGEASTPIVLCGDEALCDRLREEFADPPRRLQESAGAQFGEIASGEERALALALLAAQTHPAVPNFRSGPFGYQAPSEETRRQLRRTAWIAAAVLLIVLGSWGVVIGERRAELADLQARIRSTAAPIVRNAPRGTEVRRIRSALDDLERRSTMLGGGVRRAATLDRLFSIHEAIPTEIPLEVIDLSIDQDGVNFRGRTDTFESVDVVTRALEALPAFETAEVQDVKAGVDGRIEFRASLEGAAG